MTLSGALLSVLVPVLASAEIAIRENWVPASQSLGDVWTFSCPAGGSVDVTVQNKDDGAGSDIDLLMAVVDPDGTPVGGGDDEVPCLNPGCFACPQDLAVPCTAGGVYSIVIRGFNNCGVTGIGGGYSLAVEVKDSAAVAVTAKKAKLGGGPKSKVPAWHSATSAPAVDDGSPD
jgi:hypothetical protein